MRIVHVMIFEKFIRAYIEFLDENFDIDEHTFLIIGKDYKKYDLSGLPNVYFINNPIKVPALLLKLYAASKIIIHGLWDKRFIKILLLQPWLIKKCYWMMWGGDFYNYENETADKKKLIRRLKHFISIIKGDFDFVKKWYKAHGKLHECIAYPAQLFEFTTLPFKANNSGTIQILLGNSADPSNNHEGALQLLKTYCNNREDIQIACPLSYGGKWNADNISKLGKDLFHDKFQALKDFLPFDKYNDFLNTIDIAVFNHDRQQGVGNITSMLSKGKKVFLKKNNPLFEFFKSVNVEVYDIEYFNLAGLDLDTRNRNIENMKNYFSKENYIRQLNILFNF